MRRPTPTLRAAGVLAATIVSLSGCAVYQASDRDNADGVNYDAHAMHHDTDCDRDRVACAVPVREAPAATMTVAPVAEAPRQPLKPPRTRLKAVGFGAMGSFSQYSLGQARLMAMRAAQVDAYRNLAEQVFGFQISGSTTVSAFAAQNDAVRVYVDAFVRGARVVNLTSIADGNIEATVEIDLSPAFARCVIDGIGCDTVPVGPINDYTGTGYGSAGVTYVTP